MQWKSCARASGFESDGRSGCGKESKSDYANAVSVILTGSGSKNTTGASMGSWTGNRIDRGSSACVEGCWSASSHLVYSLGNVCEPRVLHFEEAGIASGCCVCQTDQEDLLGDHHAHGMASLNLGKVVDYNDFRVQIFRSGTAEESSNEMENGTASGKETVLDARDHFELVGRLQAGEERVNEGAANLRALR